MVWPILVSSGHQHNKAQRWGGNHPVLHSSQQQALPGHVRPRSGAAEGLCCTGQVNPSPQGRILVIYKNLNNYIIFLGGRYQCTDTHAVAGSLALDHIEYQSNMSKHISRGNYYLLKLQCSLHFFFFKSVACRNKCRDKCWMLQFSLSLKGFFYIKCFEFMSLFTFMEPKFKPLRAKKVLPFGKHSKTNTFESWWKEEPWQNHQFRTAYTVAW